jgi:hypothetical protein
MHDQSREILVGSPDCFPPAVWYSVVLDTTWWWRKELKMQMQLDELWLDALADKVDENVARYLKEHHPEYQETLDRQAGILKDYPVLMRVFEGTEDIEMDEQEHRAFREYMANRDDVERLEREYYYYYGQSHMFLYGKMMRRLQRDIGWKNDDPEGDEPRKKKLMDLLTEARTGDAELDFLKTDEEYCRRRSASTQQEKMLKEMKLPKEAMDQIDRVVNAHGDCWCRYSDLLYQYAVKDILALLFD